MKDALTFRLDDELFAIDARSVVEILEPIPVTHVPGAPACIDAVLNVRGRVVPLADLRVLFGMQRKQADVNTRVVVIELALEGEDVILAIVADAVHDVTDLEPGAIEDAPRIGMRWPPELLRGVGRRGDEFVMLPDMARVLELLCEVPTTPLIRAAA